MQLEHPGALPGNLADVTASRHWHRDAVIYQTHVRAFFDSDGDGIGDFPGLTEKLDTIGTSPYPITLTGHGFFWLKLLPEAEAERRRVEPLEAGDRPPLPTANRPVPVPPAG